MQKLTDEQIKQKLSEGRNYKRLYYELKEKYDAVVAENKQLKALLAEQRALFEAIIEPRMLVYARLLTFYKACAIFML